MLFYRGISEGIIGGRYNYLDCASFEMYARDSHVFGDLHSSPRWCIYYDPLDSFSPLVFHRRPLLDQGID